MGNTLTSLIPTIYSALDVVSREMVGFIPAVFKNSSAEGAALGQDITVPIAPEAVASDITPGTTAPTGSGQTIGNTSMKISKARGVPIPWTGEEQLSVKGQYGSILTDQFVQAFRALSNEVESDIGSLYVQSSRAYGVAGTTPFGSAADFSDFAGAKKLLEDNGAPKTGLQMVLGSSAISNLRGKQSSLFKANEAGTDDLLRRGILGQIEGFDIHNSAAVKAHTKGTGSSYVADLVAGYDIGDSSIHVDTGTGTCVAGDVVTFASDAEKYIAKTGFAGDGDSDLVIADPGLRAALVDNAAMTIGNNYTANMFFARSAIQLITRAPKMPVGPDGKALDMADDVLVVTDPVTGISFQIAVYRQFMQIVYYVGLAWGQKMIKPGHTGILLG